MLWCIEECTKTRQTIIKTLVLIMIAAASIATAKPSAEYVRDQIIVKFNEQASSAFRSLKKSCRLCKAKWRHDLKFHKYLSLPSFSFSLDYTFLTLNSLFFFKLFSSLFRFERINPIKTSYNSSIYRCIALVSYFS